MADFKPIEQTRRYVEAFVDTLREQGHSAENIAAALYPHAAVEVARTLQAASQAQQPAQQTDLHAAIPLETVALAAGATVRDGESITFSVEAWQQFRAALVAASPQQPAQQVPAGYELVWLWPDPDAGGRWKIAQTTPPPAKARPLLLKVHA
jgi:hypothetical protein